MPDSECSPWCVAVQADRDHAKNGWHDPVWARKPLGERHSPESSPAVLVYGMPNIRDVFREAVEWRVLIDLRETLENVFRF